MSRHIKFEACSRHFGLLAAMLALLFGGLLAGTAKAQDEGFWEMAADAAETEAPADDSAPEPAVDAAAEDADTGDDETAETDAAASGEEEDFSGIEMAPEELIAFEKIRRQELVLRAEHELEVAREAFLNNEFEQAVENYQAAKNHYLQAGNTAEIQEKARKIDQLTAKVYVEWADTVANEAETLADAKQFEDAIEKAQQAAQLNPKEGKVMAERVKRYQAMQQKAIIQSQTALDQIDPTAEDRDQQIEIYLERGRRLYNRRRYIAARDEYEQVLVLDPFNIDATTGLFNINKKLKAYAEARRTVTEMERIAENAWKWTEPITPLSDDVLSDQETEAVVKPETTKIERKLETIILPRIDFEEATIHQVIRYLRDKSRELDPEGKGVSIVFQKGGQDQEEEPAFDAGGPGPATEPGFDFGEDVDDWGIEGTDTMEPGLETPTGTGAATTAGQPGGTVTIAATDIPLGDAIRFVCESAGLEYVVTQYAVIIGDAIEREMEVRIFDVPATLYGPKGTREAESLMEGWAGQAVGAGEEESEDNDMRAFFSTMGIDFPPGSAAKLISNRTKLWARNTPENLKLIKMFLDAIIKDELQVTIEAKFVEISQNDLEALGFEWLINNGDGLSYNSITDEYEWSNGGKWGYGSEGKSAILKQDPNLTWPFNSALTGALRYATFDPTFFSGNDQVVSIQSVLGSMEFTTVIHALNRADSTDVLSCPKVTAKSDETAILRMVTERFFPESWTEPEIESGGSEENSTFKPSIPEFGEARDIGVVLEATPKIDPKKEYLIDLLLRPQVYDFLGYDTDLNYEMIIDGEEVEGKAQMPIIAARTVETSVLVWDGETVVLGGMIQEHLEEYDDKVPILGDIPILGRLFQSRGKKSEKRNLLIFVTARLVDPAGRPKRATHDLRGIVDFRR